MTLNITSKTGVDVARTVKRQFGDESGVQLTDEDIIRWINDGQKEIVDKNRVLKGKASITSVSGQADYTLPEANITAIESIHWAGYPLRAVAYPEVEAFIRENPDLHRTGTGTPTMWYEWGGIVTFWPVPQREDTITLLYTRSPDTIASLTEPLSIPDKYFNTLIQYVLVQAYEMDEDWDASHYKSQQFQINLDSTADDERTTQNMTYPVINEIVDY